MIYNKCKGANLSRYPRTVPNPTTKDVFFSLFYVFLVTSFTPLMAWVLLLCHGVSMHSGWPAKGSATPTAGFGAICDGETATWTVFSHCVSSSR